MKEIRIAIAGVGNCASAVIQGVQYYENTNDELIGVVKEVGGYTLAELNFVLGFDVHKDKVGKPLNEAIFVEPNCAEFIYKPTGSYGLVLKCDVLDGLDSAIADFVPTDKNQKSVDVETALRENKVDVLVILLPTGSQQAAEYYARAALNAGCGVVNGIPATIANNPELVQLAQTKKRPIIGDDVKSQIGATITHRALTNLFPMRHAVVDRTIQ